MAKISAHGDGEIRRVESGSYVYVLTRKGRLLRKIRYSDGTSSGFTLLKTGLVGERGEDYMRRLSGNLRAMSPKEE